MNEPVRHHWWPQAHQRFWVNTSGQIVCVDRSGKVYSTPPVDTAVIRHHNSIFRKDGSRNTEPEKILGRKVDAGIQPTLTKIADLQRRTFVPAKEVVGKDVLDRYNARGEKFGFDQIEMCEFITLQREDRFNLAKYIASMILRVPPFRNRISASYRSIAAVLQRHGTTFPDLDKADHNHQIAWMLENLPAFARSIALWHWVFVKAAPSKKFIFSDGPVDLSIPNGLDGGLADFSFPVLPTLTLCGLDRPQSSVPTEVYVMQANDGGTDRYNRTVLGNAEERIYMQDLPTDNEKKSLTKLIGVPGKKDIVLHTDGREIKVDLRSED